MSGQAREPARSSEVKVVDTGSQGDWAACDECAELIRKNAWNRVLQRAVDAFPIHAGESMQGEVQDQIRRMHRQHASTLDKMARRELRRSSGARKAGQSGTQRARGRPKGPQRGAAMMAYKRPELGDTAWSG
jgi:hypothetical protein